MSNGSQQVDDMQNTAIKAIDRRLQDLEQKHGELQVQFADLMGRMDLIIKGGRWLIGAVALGLGLDAHGIVGEL
jgi:hypothetical protein